MKYWLWIIVVVVGGGGAYLAMAHLSGGAFPTLGLPIGGELGALRGMALQFWEDIQFKDFKKAASYHAPELQDAVDIPYLIQRIFMVKPEMLDLMDYEIVLAELDASGLRARVKTRVKAKILATEKIEEREVMLYFKRKDLDSPWYMELEDSLRPAEADKEKKH